jgi:hypothetical protein
MGAVPDIYTRQTGQVYVDTTDPANVFYDTGGGATLRPKDGSSVSILDNPDPINVNDNSVVKQVKTADDFLYINGVVRYHVSWTRVFERDDKGGAWGKPADTVAGKPADSLGGFANTPFLIGISNDTSRAVLSNFPKK